MNLSRISLPNAALAVLATGIMLAAGEVALRSAGRFKTYYERAGLVESGHRVEQQVEPWLWTHHPNGRWMREQSEFKELEVTNSLGIIGGEFPIAKDQGEFRILVLGDSFTQGVGANGKSYPLALQRRLDSRARGRIRVINAGVSGSDPVFELELLRRKLLPYRPDLVVMTVNRTDVIEFVRRGGIDRFGVDGFLKPRQFPWWTPIFDHLHLARGWLIGALGYDWDLYSQKEGRERLSRACEDLVRVGAEFQRLGRAQGFRTLTVVQPLWQELAEGKMMPELVKVEEGFRSSSVEFADLLPAMTARLPEGGVNPSYYWPQDGHYTPKGYDLLASAVEEALLKGNYLPLR